MRPLHNPMTGLETDFSFNRLCFFATITNMSCITKLFHQITYLIAIIALIQTYTLRLLLCRLRTFYRNTLYSCLYHFAIMPIGTCNCQTNRHTSSIREHTTFDPVFSPVSGVWAGFFPRPAGLWSSRRPSLAISNQSLSTRRSLPRPVPTVCEKLPLRSTPENANERYCSSRCRFRSGRSTDSPSGAQIIWHPSPCGLAHVACRRRSGGCWGVWVAVARSFSIIRLKSGIDSLYSVLSSLNPFKGTVACEYIGNSGVFRIGS
jgi:hypothetical protein